MDIDRSEIKINEFYEEYEYLYKEKLVNVKLPDEYILFKNLVHSLTLSIPSNLKTHEIIKYVKDFAYANQCIEIDTAFFSEEQFNDLYPFTNGIRYMGINIVCIDSIKNKFGYFTARNTDENTYPYYYIIKPSK